MVKITRMTLLAGACTISGLQVDMRDQFGISQAILWVARQRGRYAEPA